MTWMYYPAYKVLNLLPVTKYNEGKVFPCVLFLTFLLTLFTIRGIIARQTKYLFHPSDTMGVYVTMHYMLAYEFKNNKYAILRESLKHLLLCLAIITSLWVEVNDGNYPILIFQLVSRYGSRKAQYFLLSPVIYCRLIKMQRNVKPQYCLLVLAAGNILSIPPALVFI